MGQLVRRRALLRGIVQGVGFRPHVARVAARFPVTGFCGNDDEQVFIEAQGAADDVAAFLAAVVAEVPPLARVLDESSSDIAAVPGEAGFRIVTSRRQPGAVTLIPPDLAVCDDCLADMADPANRRYRYPFTTCTNCGPRLSIIRDVPYDRPLTTMAEFPMCDACRREYEDPLDRRFHAQPISCWDCGPTLWLRTNVTLSAAKGLGAGPGNVILSEAKDLGEPSRDLPSQADQRSFSCDSGAGAPPRRMTSALAGAALRMTRELLAQGKIVAVKGIGGYTLFCDARNEGAVARLRQRKHRPGKPFAVMAASLATAERIARFSDAQRAALTSPERPIILIPQGPGYDLADAVAPGLADVGIMLPYAPLHHLLVAEGEVYVATSGNLSGEPLAYEDDDAVARLGHIADAFLGHDRGIHVPVEDSVLMADADGLTPIRRSRGYAPLPVRLGREDAAVLAVGGELKNTFALTRDGMAFLSAHIGDMESLESQRAFDRSVAQLTTMHRRRPALVVADLHPGYATTAWAERYADRTGVPLLQVQHHHAHALSLVAEHGLVGQPITVIAFDGTGYGPDGTVWGGEILCLGEDPRAYERAWHLPEFALPGGDSAVANPWKCAAGWLGGVADLPDHVVAEVAPEELELVDWQLRTGTAVVRTTSAGRLFDAVASLLGVRQHVTYEAQAAMELEAVATKSDVILAFHVRLATLVADAAVDAAAARGHDLIGLTGGVAVNRLFTRALAARVRTRGARLVAHQLVPANDGGLALGQALAGYLTCVKGELA